MHQSLGLINELIIIFAASVVVSALFGRFRVPTIVCYLLVGIVLGPGFHVITSVEQFRVIAEFGVAFLLFTLGLEFSLPRLLALRRAVFGMGTVQVAVCIALFGLLIYLTRDYYNISVTGILIAASALALSSTAIVTRELSRRNEVATAHGNMAIGILLFQDIAAIVMLVLISVSGDLSGSEIWISLGFAAVKAAAFFVVMAILGKQVLPRLFTEIGRMRSEEMFVLTVLLVALLSAAVAHGLGLSMALGAFMAGMMLGESHFRHQIESEIRPFRDVLLGIFFVSVGLIIELEMLLQFWPRIVVFALCLLAFKAVLIGLLCQLFGARSGDALRTGVILSQGGEFGFALLALAVSGDLIPPDVASFFLSIIVLSMGLTPFLVSNSRRIANYLTARRSPVDDDLELVPGGDDFHDHVILCGFGRVGQTIARFLEMEGIRYLAIDDDPIRVERARAMGQPVIFGSARKMKLLEHLGIDRAALLIVSFDDPRSAVEIVSQIRHERQELPILVRTRDDAQLKALQEAGATEVIPETLEASLMLVSHVMASLGLPARQVFETIRQVRRERYRLLHGFVAGERGGTEYVGRLQPLYLPENAAAVGKTLADLPLADLEARVHTIRRDGEVIVNPPPETLLRAEDIVVLSGEESALEKAEGMFLSGRGMKS